MRGFEGGFDEKEEDNGGESQGLLRVVKPLASTRPTPSSWVRPAQLGWFSQLCHMISPSYEDHFVDSILYTHY